MLPINPNLLREGLGLAQLWDFCGVLGSWGLGDGSVLWVGNGRKDAHFGRTIVWPKVGMCTEGSGEDRIRTVGDWPDGCAKGAQEHPSLPVNSDPTSSFSSSYRMGNFLCCLLFLSGNTCFLTLSHQTHGCAFSLPYFPKFIPWGFNTSLVEN